MWVPSLEAGRPEDARRSLVAGMQDRACGERLLEEGRQGGTRVRSSRSGSQKTQVWGTAGSFEDKNTGQARQAFWAGLGVRVGRGTSVLPWLWLLWWPVRPSVIVLTVEHLHDHLGGRPGFSCQQGKESQDGERNR